MTITVVQNRAVTGSTFSFASSPTDGNVVVVAGMTNFGSAPLTAPTGFAGTSEGPNTTATSDDYAGMYWKRWTTTDGNSFTIGNMGGIVGTYGWELSGLTDGSLIAFINTNSGASAGEAMPLLTTGATPTEDSFACSVMAANALFTSPAVAGFGDCVKVVNPGAVAWEIFATQQTDLVAAWTWTNVVRPVGILVVFNGTDGGVTPPTGSSMPEFLNVDGDWVSAVSYVNESGAWA